VDDIITVSDAEVRKAMLTLYRAGLTAEPSGACAAAGALFHAAGLLPFRRVAAIMSGGNVEPEILQAVLAEGGVS
jgi:threonine dehydratase